ncbi:MAG: hypothetical protein KDD19_06020 [Phaeodactylibacter sp.]|nr:hypothetical protein [Phaeodactylibacter sp.]MCB9054142.1 hypothetical protein [Lewinellaceae bacterium]
MKSYLFTLVFALVFCGFAMAQSSDQNPRAQQAYEAYAEKADNSHAASLGATVDKTYEAHDPILIKEQRREDRREFRRQLRLERARRPIIQNNPFGYYPYW